MTKTQRWMSGLFAGFIRGGAHSVASSAVLSVIDTAHDTIGHILFVAGCLFISSGIVSTAMYLQAHKLPFEEEGP